MTENRRITRKMSIIGYTFVGFSLILGMIVLTQILITGLITGLAYFGIIFYFLYPTDKFIVTAPPQVILADKPTISVKYKSSTLPIYELICGNELCLHTESHHLNEQGGKRTCDVSSCRCIGFQSEGAITKRIFESDTK